MEPRGSKLYFGIPSAIFEYTGPPLKRTWKAAVIHSADENLTLGEQLKAIKQQLFIERPHELQLLDGALRGAPREWHILNIHGPGGIGKSTLLDAYRRLCEERIVPYLYIDLGDLAPRPDHFLERCATLLESTASDLEAVVNEIGRTTLHGPMVIAIDTYEEAGELNRWLRENFLVRLPKRCLVVIAGRYALTGLWKNHSLWHRLIEERRLGNFSRDQCHEFLQRSGLPQRELLDQAWRNSNGYPLALSLCAMVAQREGPQSLAQFASHPDIVAALTQRWLREIGNHRLRELIEAAALTRFFNQELLGAITGEAVDAEEFRQLLATSFIRRRSHDWAIHGTVRQALANELKQRAPERYRQLRLRALKTLAQLAITPRSAIDRSAALHEFFYQLGDSLVRAALYNEEIDPRPELHIEGATPHDIPALERYMDEWRRERGVLAPTAVELFDHSSSLTIPGEIVSEPREPEFIQIRELVERFPGAIRLLEDNTSTLHGLSIVLPINGATLEYLRGQPVTGSLFHSLEGAALQEYLTPPETTSNWFVRLIDTRDPGDNAARATLLRDLTALLIRPARFITSTPLPLYQALLGYYGFRPMELPPQYDFGRERPAPYFMLDLRGGNLARHLDALIRQHMGEGIELPFESLLAAANPGTVEDGPHRERERQLLLERLSQREREVARLASEGLPNCTIAARLDISEVTVKKHMGNIFAKLGLRNRHELIKTFWAGGQPREEGV